MAKEATVLAMSGAKERDDGLDLSKPVQMKFWALPHGTMYGNGTSRMATVGGSFNNHEGASGLVKEILFYPATGVVDIVIQPNWMGRPEDMPPVRHILCTANCHGQALTADELETLRKTGKVG